MSMRERIVLRLKEYPSLYRLAGKVYYALAPYHLLELFIGTKAQEGRWVKKPIGEDYWDSRNHPAKQYLANWIASLSPHSRILEIGCASGPNLYTLAKKLPEAELIGIDINAAAVDYGNRQFASEGISNVKLLIGKADSIEQIP